MKIAPYLETSRIVFFFVPCLINELFVFVFSFIEFDDVLVHCIGVAPMVPLVLIHPLCNLFLYLELLYILFFLLSASLYSKELVIAWRLTDLEYDTVCQAGALDGIGEALPCLGVILLLLDVRLVHVSN